MSPNTSASRPAATTHRWLALTILGVATVATPLTAFAQPAPRATPVTRHAADSMRRETLDQRISNMHVALKITPAEEADWTKVADVMRRNESNMQKMVVERRAHIPHELNAVEDLKTYQRFTQAHVDGLKDLIASFETLYAAMPEGQKIVADHVFARYGHERVQTHRALKSNS